MTRVISKRSVDDLVRAFLGEVGAQRRASKYEKNVPAYNRSVLRMIPIARELSDRPQGRNALQNILFNTDPFIRLCAAQYVRHWAPDLAVPVLGRLLVEDFKAELTPGERLEVRLSAKDSLYFHFNIKTFDHNDLIAPLAAYGIDLPWRDHGAWQ